MYLNSSNLKKDPLRTRIVTYLKDPLCTRIVDILKKDPLFGRGHSR